MARVSIEDCLEKIENRFALVSVASHRTRQLMSGKTPLVKTKNKEAVTALREIAEGLVIPTVDVSRENFGKEKVPLTRKPEPAPVAHGASASTELDAKASSEQAPTGTTES